MKRFKNFRQYAKAWQDSPGFNLPSRWVAIPFEDIPGAGETAIVYDIRNNTVLNFVLDIEEPGVGADVSTIVIGPSTNEGSIAEPFLFQEDALVKAIHAGFPIKADNVGLVVMGVKPTGIKGTLWLEIV